jgi:hypothetical protein
MELQLLQLHRRIDRFASPIHKYMDSSLHTRTVYSLFLFVFSHVMQYYWLCFFVSYRKVPSKYNWSFLFSIIRLQLFWPSSQLGCWRQLRVTFLNGR